jgi:hypothetical protein
MMRCSEVGLRTQEMLTNNRNTAVKPTAFKKQSMKPHRGDDSQTRAVLSQQHGRSYRRFANTGRSEPTTGSSRSTTWGHPTIRNDAKAVRFSVATPGHSQSYWRVGQRSCTLDTRNSDFRSLKWKAFNDAML